LPSSLRVGLAAAGAKGVDPVSVFSLGIVGVIFGLLCGAGATTVGFVFGSGVGLGGADLDDGSAGASSGAGPIAVNIVVLVSELSF